MEDGAAIVRSKHYDKLTVTGSINLKPRQPPEFDSFPYVSIHKSPGSQRNYILYTYRKHTEKPWMEFDQCFFGTAEVRRLTLSLRRDEMTLVDITKSTISDFVLE